MSENPYESDEPARPTGRIDECVFGRLDRMGIEPARLCSDAVFLRRAFVDVIGTLPTSRETRQFLNDPDPDKRRALVDRLLGRDEFADFWAMKWSDLLRIKAEFPINLWPEGAQTYYRWIHAAVRDNLPYDRFARELLTASGSNFRVGPANFFRAARGRDPATIARAVALAFMGERAEKWPAARLAAMSAFFSRVAFKKTGEWKEEIVYDDPDKPSPPSPPEARFPDGTRPPAAPDRDPRALFADWLVSPGNPWFARAAANRAWSWLFGRGIVEEPDDFREDNPPSNPELLDCLASELVSSRYDLKALFRRILNSATYHLSFVPRSDHPQAAAQFAHRQLRRLGAEALIDAIDQITGTRESYSSAIPEPYTFIPKDRRTVTLPDGSITSTFLVAFGRPPRDTGLESERDDRITAAQRLCLLNSTQIQRKLQQGPAIQGLLRGRSGPDATAERLYLAILSRPPTLDELDLFASYADSVRANPRAAALDLAWALINGAEFLYRH